MAKSAVVELSLHLGAEGCSWFKTRVETYSAGTERQSAVFSNGHFMCVVFLYDWWMISSHEFVRDFFMVFRVV